MSSETCTTYINNAYLLTDDEIKSIVSYIKQWRNILYSHALIGKAKVIDIVRKAYKILELPEPKILFKRNFNYAKRWIAKNYKELLTCDDYHQIYCEIRDLVFKNMLSEIYSKRYAKYSRLFPREHEYFSNIYLVACEIIYKVFDTWVHIYPEYMNLVYSQYYIEVLGRNFNVEPWEILKKLSIECHFLIPLTDVCLVIDRPVEVHLNDDLLPHAKNKPAIKFAGGFSVYCHHGVEFPAQYGKLPVERWKPK
jgi:hypothetical protein